VSGPPPPSDLAGRVPEIVRLPVGTDVHRFYSSRFDPIHFDRSSDGRLNSPDGSYGVLYVAREPSGAFAETFLRRPGRTLIDTSFLSRKAYVRLRITSAMTVVRLAGPGLAIFGATAEVTHSGLPYDVSQAWSKALFAHPIGPAGIAYHARHDDEALCYALHERCAGGLAEVERIVDLDADWFWRLAERYRIGLSPS